MTRDELTSLHTNGTITAKELDTLILHDIKGLSYQQIALAHRVSRQTIQERAHRAHTKITHAKEAA